MATHIDPARVAEIIAWSPGWTRVALTAGNADLREAAAQTLGDLIAARHDEPAPCHDSRQLGLPL